MWRLNKRGNVRRKTQNVNKTVKFWMNHDIDNMHDSLIFRRYSYQWNHWIAQRCVTFYQIAVMKTWAFEFGSGNDISSGAFSERQWSDSRMKSVRFSVKNGCFRTKSHGHLFNLLLCISHFSIGKIFFLSLPELIWTATSFQRVRDNI